MTSNFKTISGPLFGLLMLVVILPSTGCEEFDPNPRLPVGDTALLYSLARAEHIGLWSGYDFTGPRSVVIEAPRDQEFPSFDVAFSELDGDFVMLPAGLFESYEVEPGLIVDSSGVTFEEYSRAPETGFVTDRAVELREGPVYVVRTRSQGACRQYAKFEVLDLDPAGILEFRFLANNVCNDRDLSEAEPD